jgi:hypothetical protein
MTNKRKRARRLTVWRRYQARIDRLTERQPMTADCLAPMRSNAGFFRAEGWNTDDVRSFLRHGA